MTLEEIKREAIRFLPWYANQIERLINNKMFWELHELLRKSDKSAETAYIRRALLEEYIDA